MDWILGSEIVCVVLAWSAVNRWPFGASARQTEVAKRVEEEARAERERLERELVTLRSDHQALMERCGAGVLILDANGVIERANLFARQIMSIPTQTLVGKTLLQATLSDELDALFRTARDTQSPQEQEVRAPAVGGCSLIVSISLLPSPVGQPDRNSSVGHAARFLLIAHNVTELRRLETIRRDFVANVSHELRTPLASIRAMAETLQDGALEDPTVSGRFLGTIVTETQRLTRIAEDLLVLSDAESHLPEKQWISLSDMIGELVSRFHPQAEKAGIKLTANVPHGLEACANPDQMEQVILNLVDNAIKYTGRGGNVHVTGERVPHGVALHIADTGIGILSQDLPRIFERFYRVDKARSRESGGTGLGLSIVKHIVEAHGGRVTVQSEFNHGSTFTVMLPITPADQTSQPALSLEHEATAGEESSSRSDSAERNVR